MSAVELVREPVESAAGLLDALVRAGCRTTSRNEAECPVCRTGLTLKVRGGGSQRVQVWCSNECSEASIEAALRVDLAAPASAVLGGSRTSSNRGAVSGSAALRAEPVRTAVRANRSAEEVRTALGFESLDAFLARTAMLPDPVWLVKDLVPDCGRVHFAAAPSAGKTFLALVVAKEAATVGRPVYLVLEEGGAKPTGNRFRDMRFPAASPVHVLHQHGFRLIDHTAAVVELLHAGLEGPAPVVVLDPFASIFSGDENETKDVKIATDLMDVLMRADPRLLLVVPHHTSKAGERGDVGTPMHAGRGGTGLPGWADVQLNLKHVSTPKGSGRIEFDALMAKNRDGERDYTIRVTIELGTGEVTMKPAGEAHREAKASDLRARMLEAFAKATGPLTKNRICSEVKGTKADKLAMVDALTDEGVLRNDGVGWFLNRNEEAKP